MGIAPELEAEIEQQQAALKDMRDKLSELRGYLHWKPMNTAPKTGEIIVWAKRAGGKGALIAHWAQDLSGSEQPPFIGWFYWTGHGFTEVCEPEAWSPLPVEEPK